MRAERLHRDPGTKWPVQHITRRIALDGTISRLRPEKKGEASFRISSRWTRRASDASDVEGYIESDDERMLFVR